MTLGCDETTSLTSLSWCNSCGVNSTHHCHYTMASADSSLKIFVCSVFKLNNKNVNAFIARELLGLTCTCSLAMNMKFSIPHSAALCGIEISCSFMKFLVHSLVSELVQVNPDNSLPECVNL